MDIDIFIHFIFIHIRNISILDFLECWFREWYYVSWMVGECVSVGERERREHVELEHKFMSVQVQATSNWYNLFGRLSFVYRSLFYARALTIFSLSGMEQRTRDWHRQQVMRSKAEQITKTSQKIVEPFRSSSENMHAQKWRVGKWKWNTNWSV